MIFTCPICNKDFISEENLWRHRHNRRECSTLGIQSSMLHNLRRSSRQSTSQLSSFDRTSNTDVSTSDVARINVLAQREDASQQVDSKFTSYLDEDQGTLSSERCNPSFDSEDDHLSNNSNTWHTDVHTPSRAHEVNSHSDDSTIPSPDFHSKDDTTNEHTFDVTEGENIIFSPQNNSRPHSHTVNDVCYLQLLEIFNAFGEPPPLETFDKVMIWAANAYSKGFKFNANHPTRKTFLSRLKKNIQNGRSCSQSHSNNSGRP